MLIQVTTLAALACSQGAAVRVNAAPMPPALDVMSGEQALTTLGLEGAPAAATIPDIDAAALQGEKLFWGQGNAKAAIQQLEALRSGLPGILPAASQDRALGALWLLGHLLLQQGDPEQARAVVDQSLALAPYKSPSLKEFSPELVALHQERESGFRARASLLRVQAPAGCRVRLDGTDVGPVSRDLGPFEPGRRNVSLSCAQGDTPGRSVDLTTGSVNVSVSAWEPGLSAESRSLATPDAAKASGIAAALLANNVGWVIVIEAASDGAVTCQLHRASGVTHSELLAPEDVADWVAGEHEAPITLPETGAARSSRWWHWAVLGAGVVAAGAGGALHAVGDGAMSETNDGLVNRIDEAANLRTGAYVLYGVGAAAVVSGLTLALIGSPDDGVSVAPSPGGATLGARF